MEQLSCSIALLQQTLRLIVSMGAAVRILLKYSYGDAAFVIAVTLDPAY